MNQRPQGFLPCMRYSIIYSCNLLADEVRRVRQQLAVFRGGFSRDAAERVADATLLSLSALMDKSLLGRHHTRRFDLHELIRQYSALRLAQMSRREALPTEGVRNII